MQIPRLAAFVYAALTFGVIFFQTALALGAPWGTYAMGGSHPGALPLALRVTAAVQAGILVLLALITCSRAGLLLRTWEPISRKLIWITVAFCGLSLLLNLVTPSRGERAVWAPVAGLLLLTSLTVALGSPSQKKS